MVPEAGCLKREMQEFLMMMEGISFRKSRRMVIRGSTRKYENYGNGMWSKVIRKDETEVTFKYDSLGRRIEKNSNETIKFVWDGNTILHGYFTQSDSDKSENLVGNSNQTDARYTR